jgi:hypothetical protein
MDAQPRITWEHAVARTVSEAMATVLGRRHPDSSEAMRAVVSSGRLAALFTWISRRSRTFCRDVPSPRRQQSPYAVPPGWRMPRSIYPRSIPRTTKRLRPRGDLSPFFPQPGGPVQPWLLVHDLGLAELFTAREIDERSGHVRRLRRQQP